MTTDMLNGIFQDLMIGLLHTFPFLDYCTCVGIELSLKTLKTCLT